MDISIDEVVDLAQYLENHVYNVRNQAFLEDEMMYNLQFKHLLGLPQEHMKHAVCLSKCRDDVDTYCNHTSINNARVNVDKYNPSQPLTDYCKMERMFGQGILYHMNKNNTISPLWTANKHYWIHGQGVIRTLWVADLWPDKPIRKKDESDESYLTRLNKWQEETGRSLPISIRAIHPINYYPDADSREPEFVIEINEYVWHKAKKFKKWENIYDKKGDDNVKHISYWDKDKHCEIVDGQAIVKTKSGWDYHGYGFIPYVEFNSGLGNMSSKNDMAEKYVGLPRFAKDMYIAQSASYSINNIVLRKNAWPTIYLKGENAGSTQLKETFGGANIIPEDVEVIEHQHAVPPPQIVEHFALTTEMLEAHGASRTMFGQGESGVRSGAHQRLISSEGLSRLNHAVESFKNRLPVVLDYAARLFVNVIPGDVQVMGNGSSGPFMEFINKSKMKEPFNYTVEFAPISEEDEYRRHDDLIRLTQSGLYSKRKAWEQMTNVDPDLMEEQLVEQIMSESPAIMEAEMKAIATLYNKAMVERLGAEAVMASGSQGMGGGMPTQRSQVQQNGSMVPDMTNRAQPGSAQQIQQQIANRQGPNPMSGQQGQGGGGNRGTYR